MWQTQSAGPVRTAHMSVLLTVNIVSYNPARSSSDNIPSWRTIILTMLQIVHRLKWLTFGIIIESHLCSSSAYSALRCCLQSSCSFSNAWRNNARRPQPLKTVNTRQSKTVQPRCYWSRMTSRKHHCMEESGGGKSWLSCCDRLGCYRQPLISRSSTANRQLPECREVCFWTRCSKLRR